MSSRYKVKIGTAVASEGEIGRGCLTVGRRRDSAELLVPVTVIVGKTRGPTVWIQAAIHGDERAGAAAILELIRHVSPNRLAGTLVCVPVVNTVAYENDSRSAFVDNKDMNRVISGNPNGTYSEQVASVLIKHVFDTASHVLDLHVGSHRECTYQVLYRDLEMNASKEARGWAEDMGAPVIWASREAELRDSVLHVATERGIPSLVLEMGGGRISRYLADIEEVLLNALRALGMITGIIELPQERLYVNNWHRVYCRKGGGILEPVREPGNIVQAGELLGNIISLHGEVVETLRSPSGPSFIRRMAKSYCPLAIGEQAFALLSIVDRKKAKG